MELSDVLGYVAAFLTTVSFVPQAWRCFRTRDVSGISLKMYTVFTLGVGVWLAYGIALGQAPMIISNAVTLLLACTVLVMKVRYGRRPRDEHASADDHGVRRKRALLPSPDGVCAPSTPELDRQQHPHRAGHVMMGRTAKPPCPDSARANASSSPISTCR